MPTYEYRCRDCGHSFDIVQKMSDDQLTHCPECGGDLRKVFTAPAISFKGSGFYANDHGSKSKKPTGGDSAEKGDSADKKDGSTSDTKKTDTKKSEGGGSSSSSDSSSSSSTTKKEGSS
jgi:putative FmdB family regulatory protein